MMVEDTTLSEHLHKVVSIKSEQELENLLKLLWQTRKTGLSAPQRSSLQSLLKLPSTGDLDPVLASLRSLIRDSVHKNLEGDDILKLLPPDLPLELQSMLRILLQKHQSQWKGELSQEQHVLGWTRFSQQLNAGLSAPLLSFSSSQFSGSLLSPRVDPVPQFNSHNLGGPTPVTAERYVLCFPQLTLQNDVVPPEIRDVTLIQDKCEHYMEAGRVVALAVVKIKSYLLLQECLNGEEHPFESCLLDLPNREGVFPQVKSMTWTVENKSGMPANQVAIITLKLQDYTKSPSNEMDVKFQLTKDTLEAVLRSMTYIKEQLSRYVGSSSAPLQKKRRQ